MGLGSCTPCITIVRVCLLIDDRFARFFDRDVRPNEKDVKHTELFTASKDGSHAITVIFNSKQLTDVKNTISVPVSAVELRFGFNSHRGTQRETYQIENI